MFADVKKSDPESITEENTDLFMERYRNYKRFFEPSESMYSLTLLLNLKVH